MDRPEDDGAAGGDAPSEPTERDDTEGSDAAEALTAVDASTAASDSGGTGGNGAAGPGSPAPPALSEYERQRLERIARNRAYLQQLGLHEARPTAAQRERSRKKRTEPRPAPVKSRFSERASSRAVGSYAEPSLSIAALVRQERGARGQPRRKKEPRPPKPPKEPKPPREPRAAAAPRMQRVLYDEFRRLNTHRRQVLKLVDREVRAAEKEVKFWAKRAEKLDRREQRKADLAAREQLTEQERQILGGFSKRDLLHQVDRRMDDILALTEKYDEEFEAEELARERRIQRMETEARNKTLDALDRFPKALQDNHVLLNSVLLQRLPKDPPPPRRSRRSSANELEPTGVLESPKTKQGSVRTEETTGASVAVSTKAWQDVRTFKDNSVPMEEDKAQEDQEKDVAPQTASKIRTRSIRNVGGWISPNMAKLIDRSWLERDAPLSPDETFDLKTYAPQVGEAVLYYPAGHKEFLASYPDVLGKKLRSVQRVPLWERSSNVNENDSENQSSVKGSSTWWTEQWLDEVRNGTSPYPILCRVEKSYAEFPPDPFTKVLKKNGSTDFAQLLWKAPKDPAVMKEINGTPLRLALILRPLTPVTPSLLVPGLDYASCRLPPIFSVVTFPSKHKPFIIPFSYAYMAWHSLKVDQQVVQAKSKVRITEFAMHNGTSCRFDDNLDETAKIVARIEKAVSLSSFFDEAFPGGSKGLPTRDCQVIIETIQRLCHETEEVESSITESHNVDMMSLIARTLPLWNGVGIVRVGIVRNSQGSRTSWVSSWEITEPSLRESRKSCVPDNLARRSFDEILRRKLETVIEDFAWDNQEAGDLLYYTVTDEVAPSYSCAVPLSMSLERILSRFGNESDGGDKGCFYRGADHVISDINLILENCLLYNAPDSAIVESASIIISELKDLVYRASNVYYQELNEARKADEERRKLVMSISNESLKSGPTESEASSSQGPMVTTLRQPYRDKIDQDWLQEITPSAHWVPQAGDQIEYSHERHAAFIKGHFRSLEAEQCSVPACFAEQSKRPNEEWIQGKVLWTRAAFPKAPSKKSSDDEITFSASSTIVALGIQAIESGNIFVIYYRPCKTGEGEICSQTCDSCGLDSNSFVRSTADLSASNDILTVSTKPEQSFARIERCLLFLKRRCLKGESPTALDPNLDKASVKQGYRVQKIKPVLKSIPAFQDILFDRYEESQPAQSSKGTRGVKFTASAVVAHNPSNLKVLSDTSFIPAWAAHKERLEKDMTVSPWPKMSLELVLLRLKNGYYRDRMAVSNDIVEAFVSSVILLLSEPASRKNMPLQVRRICRLSTKATIEAPVDEPENALAVEEFDLASRIKRYRDLHAMALVCVTDIIHFECLFGLDDVPKPASSLNFMKPVSTPVKDPVREQAREKIALLVEAVGKDQLLNIFGQKFHGERASIPKTKLSVTCDGLPVCHAKYLKRVTTVTAETEDGRCINVTIRANRKIVSQLEELEDEEMDESQEEDTEQTCELNEMRVKILVRGKAAGKSGNNLLALLPGPLGDNSLVRRVEDAIPFGFKDYEQSEDLSKFVFGRPQRTDPCARCQAFRRSFFTCRVRRSHSNVDYDWTSHFERHKGIDELLVTLDPDYVPKEEEQSEAGSHNILPTTTGSANVPSESPAKDDKDDEDEDGQDDEENKDDDDETSDPRLQLEKARLALKFGKALLKQAKEYAERPARLSADFVESAYPVDPSDNHYIYCIVCGLSGDLLCCDGCSNVVHSQCITLTDVPDDDWFCEECISRRSASNNEIERDQARRKCAKDSAPKENEFGARSTKVPEREANINSTKSVDGSRNRRKARSSKSPDDEETHDDTPTAPSPEQTSSEQLSDESLDPATNGIDENMVALSLGPFLRADFDDSVIEKLSKLIYELNEARPERFRSKLRTEEPTSKDEEEERMSLSKRRKSEQDISVNEEQPPTKRRARAPRHAESPARPTEEVIELEASRFGRKRSRTQFLVENTQVGNYYAPRASPDHEPSPARRRHKSNPALWDDPFDRLNATTQAFLSTLDISNAEEFLKTRTVDISEALIKWRQKQKLPPLKGTGAIATVSIWKKLCRDAANEMGMSLASTETGSRKRSAAQGATGRRRRRRSEIAADADPIGCLSATAREFLESVSITSAKALVAMKTSDVAEDLVKWRKQKGLPPLKGSGSIATVSAWKTLCRKEMDGNVGESAVGNDKEPIAKKSTAKSAGKDAKLSENGGGASDSELEEAEPGEIDPQDPLKGLPDFAQSFLESRGIIKAQDFLETKPSEIARSYVKWRRREGLPALRGSGAGTHIGSWKAIAQNPAKSSSKRRR